MQERSGACNGGLPARVMAPGGCRKPLQRAAASPEAPLLFVGEGKNPHLNAARLCEMPLSQFRPRRWGFPEAPPRRAAGGAWKPDREDFGAALL
jgi:hypothetical protein